MAEQLARDTAAALLHDYRRPDAFFASARGTMLATGAARVFTDPSEVDAGVLAGTDVALALGALPFDPDVTTAPAALVVPERLRTASAEPHRGPVEALPSPVTVRSLPSREGHVAGVARLVERIERSPLRKAVLARVLELTFDDEVRAEPILANLVRGNRSGYQFAVELPHGAGLLGSSPELLVSRRGRQVFSHPLAGSARRESDPLRDKENAAGLATSAKNRAEHAFVVEAVVESLRPFCRSLDVPREPELLATPTMWHLGTPIRGELADLDVSALCLAQALHPTPAVCGTPRPLAREALRGLEPFDRGFYAGAVGWVDADGDGEWAVAIRCAELAERTMRLYAGGGIVAESDPVSELDETSAKFRTLLRAMGLELSA